MRDVQIRTVPHFGPSDERGPLKEVCVPLPIPDAMVERAARALAEDALMTEEFREGSARDLFMLSARSALTAALTPTTEKG